MFTCFGLMDSPSIGIFANNSRSIYVQFTVNLRSISSPIAYFTGANQLRGDVQKRCSSICFLCFSERKTMKSLHFSFFIPTFAKGKLHLTSLNIGCARHSIQASLMLCTRLHDISVKHSSKLGDFALDLHKIQ